MWRGGLTHRNGQGRGVGGGSGLIDCCCVGGEFPLIFAPGWNFVHIPPPLGRIKQKQAHTALPMMWQGGLTHQTRQGRGVGSSADQLDCCVWQGGFPLILRMAGNLSIAPPLARMTSNQALTASPMMWQEGLTCGTRRGRGMGSCRCPLDCCVLG